MDVNQLLQHSQYALPVGVVLLCAILVFVFGFKKAEQPPFAQLSAGGDVDRKIAKKRTKIKEKRSANGQIASEKPSPLKKTVSSKTESLKKSVSKSEDIEGKLKEHKQDNERISAVKKDKEVSVAKVGKENRAEQAKNKKNLKNLFQEKPVDFDEGDWEQAYSRKEKKNKKKEEESPSKKSKKTAKKADLINEAVAKQKDPEKVEIKDKVAKETENKELKEKDTKEIILVPISNEEIKEKDKDEVKVEKLEKEEKKKSKKVKKVPENEGAIVGENKPKDEDSAEDSKVPQSQEKPGAVFDELGDVWTEAKPQKKSKKKARKDN
ncbi:uncharacterized protein LOC143348429 [Colletes latitarsis]|uniref:uncharacterized protein LOC143348429 n=1 Tax=Colletes latitarsis TaxID=2605962 RepID=UPI004035F297